MWCGRAGGWAVRVCQLCFLPPHMLSLFSYPSLFSERYSYYKHQFLFLPLFLSQFSPTAGPPDGGIYVTVQGTNFGTASSHIQLVQIGRAVCDVINESYIPAVRYFLSILLCHSDVMISKFSFTCVTREVDGVEGSHPILILFSYLSQIIISTEMFELVVSCNL